MILSDAHRFAFVHIPKCAGVSVRTPLSAIDSSGGAFEHIGDHPQMGRIHYAHIPLRDLAAWFPEELAKLRAYRAMAVVRDPADRFVSAMFQRLREFKGYDQSAITPEVIAREADGVIAYLEGGPARLALEYVHFNRQSDFVDLDGERIVDALFPIEAMDAAARFVAEHTGVVIDPGEPMNRSTELLGGRVKSLVRLVKAPYSALVPYDVRNMLRDRMARAGLYAQVPKQQMVAPGGRLHSFINSYYAADIALHEAAKSAVYA